MASFWLTSAASAGKGLGPALLEAEVAFPLSLCLLLGSAWGNRETRFSWEKWLSIKEGRRMLLHAVDELRKDAAYCPKVNGRPIVLLEQNYLWSPIMSGDNMASKLSLL